MAKPVPELQEPEDTALHAAIRGGDLERVRTLLAGGADPNGENFDGMDPLSTCAYTSADLRIVQCLLDAGARANGGQVVGYRPLVEAATNDNHALAELLVDAGADANAQTGEEETALMWAVVRGNNELTGYLLSVGADPRPRDRYGRTARDFAVERRNTRALCAIDEVLAKLQGGLSDIQPPLPPSPHQHAFSEAAERGDVEALRDFIAKGVELDAPYPGTYDSAIAEAAKGNHKEVVRVLIDAGASPGAHTYWPAIVWGAIRGNIDLVKMLADAGAEVNCRSQEGAETALVCAADNANEDICRFLIERGADVNVVTSLGNTPLAAAYSSEFRSNKRSPVVELLIESGATNLGAYRKAYPSSHRPKE
ncbi:MAG: ankyrin repeat domain-containing protein [Pirellulales bacterium]